MWLEAPQAREKEGEASEEEEEEEETEEEEEEEEVEVSNPGVSPCVAPAEVQHTVDDKEPLAAHCVQQNNTRAVIG